MHPSSEPLFEPVQMGRLQLKNRLVMAPLTRMRATSIDHAPTDLHVQYYAQRASAGLIISEGTEISPDAYGWANTPGLWSRAHVDGWRQVTDAVHSLGGRIYAQLWHLGSLSHPDFFGGALPVSASDINPEQLSVTPSGKRPTVTPRPMTGADIRQTVADFRRAAAHAIEAGFDGVQLQANFVYLIAQFLNSATNRRTDEYGGSMENRARFLFEVMDALVEEVEPSRTGIKIAPMHVTGPFAANADTLPTMEYVIERLNRYDLAHLLMMGTNTDVSAGPLAHLAGDGMFEHFRRIYRGHLIANVDMTKERANSLLGRGLADSVAFGRAYIANPDLPERFRRGEPLNEVQWSTVYTGGAEGYTDYPLLNTGTVRQCSVPAEDSLAPWMCTRTMEKASR